MSAGLDQRAPSNVAYAPPVVIARHDDDDRHDTEIIPCGPPLVPADHPWPPNTIDCPSRLTATQNRGVAHDTSTNRSLRPPVPDVCSVDQEWPSNVASVL